MGPNRLNTPPARRGGWTLIALLGGAAVAAVVALVLFTNPLGGSNGSSESRYVEAVVGTPSRVNPLFAHLSEVDRDISSLVFSGLVRLDKEGQPQPDLATDWEVSSDGREVTFHLRQGVSWHNGEPFDSADVVFTFGLLANAALQGNPEQSALWQSVQCSDPDALTVVCELPEPYAPFLTFATPGILPRHILGTVTPDTLPDDAFNRAPIGTGPYRLVSLNDERALLAANEGYYRGKPEIAEIELRFYPDIAAAATDLVRGEAQGLLVDLSIEPADFQALQSIERFNQHTAHRTAYTSLFLNNTEPPLNEPAVREAIARAIDVDEIITSLLGGRATRVETPIVPDTWAWDADIEAPAHDLGAARRLLEEAGWTLGEGETARSKNNTELRISLITDQDALRGAVADMVADQLRDAGIEVSVVRQTSGDLVREFLVPRQYQAAIFGWEAGADPDPYPAWHSSQTLENGRNIAGYRSDPADELMEEARRTSELAERKDLYADFQEIFLADLPSLPLYSGLLTYFVDRTIQNVDPGVLFTPASRFRNVQEWTTEESSGITG